MRALLAPLLAFFCLAAAAQVPQPPEIAARSYLLLDVTANQILAAKDIDTPEEPASLTIEYLDSQYSDLLKMLVDNGLCAVQAYTQPTIPKDVWLRHQLSHIERYRD